VRYAPLSEKEEHIAKAIVAAAFAVHKALGPGLLSKSMRFAFAMNWANVAFVISDKS
jgi:hypothetical protein